MAQKAKKCVSDVKPTFVMPTGTDKAIFHGDKQLMGGLRNAAQSRYTVQRVD